ncbi:MAG TPA: xanthine dehydrogenase family protein subunit M [Candidatus Limnocylindrales bacterium]|nr:xanthine dehydrogenase family protein subunit M [Candidatus Limnocylindrales bacterium]
MPPVVEPPLESPATLAEAFALLAENAGEAAPDPAASGAVTSGPWRPLAGGTDLYVQMTGELGPPPARLLDLWGLDELRGIRLDGGDLVLGALTTYTEIRRSPLVREHVPALAEAAATIGAAQIQNRGTIGGNAVNASPAGDTLPVLLATDAVLVAGGSRGERPIPAGAFWPAYRTTALAPDELLLAIRIPLAAREVRFRKVGTRRAQAISKVVLALAWRGGPAGASVPSGPWSDVRVALGSVAPTPIRAAGAEAVLEGAAPTPETADRAAEALAAELRPIDDVRSTADYRRTVAARVLHRLIREAGGW